LRHCYKFIFYFKDIYFKETQDIENNHIL
jgi:hypothetical protein